MYPFGAWLYSMLIRRGMTQTGMSRVLVAAGLDRSPNTVSEWARGNHRPEPETMPSIIAALHLDEAGALGAWKAYSEPREDVQP